MKKLLILLMFLPAVALADTPIIKHTKVIDVTPTVQTSAYADGDLISSKMTFAAAARSVAPSGTVRSVTMTDLGGEGVTVDLVLFDADPSSTTFTLNSAFDIADADLDSVVCVIPINSHFAMNDNGVSVAGAGTTLQQGLDCRFHGATTLYGALMATGAVTYESTSALTIRLGIEQD